MLPALSTAILRVWGSKAATSRIEKCGTAVAVVEGKAYLLDTSDGDVSILKFIGCELCFPKCVLLQYLIITDKMPNFR